MDMQAILAGLATKRPVFHTEADFQHALAWEIHLHLPEAELRPEYPLDLAEKRMYLDMRLKHRGATVAIELKYKARELDVTWHGERFLLKGHGAQDTGRYDYIQDIERLEAATAGASNCTGYAILLTNDRLYWSEPREAVTVDAAFRLHEGRRLGGELGWQGAGTGTTSGREAPIGLDGSYALRWQDYSQPAPDRYGMFRYLLVRVNPVPLAAG